MCMRHWNELRQAIDDRGMSGMVSQGGEAAIENIKIQMDGNAEQQHYDPLLDANMMIFSRALKLGGLYLMSTKEDGTDYCPLCELEAHTEEKPEEWINGCTDAILNMCREQGWLPKIQ